MKREYTREDLIEMAEDLEGTPGWEAASVGAAALRAVARQETVAGCVFGEPGILSCLHSSGWIVSGRCESGFTPDEHVELAPRIRLEAEDA